MTKSTRKWQRRTPQQWQVLLERQAASGQSVEAFCRAESVTTASFYRWRNQLAAQGIFPQTTAPERASPTPAFVELGVGAGIDAGATAGGWELELSLGGGVALRLRGG